VGNNNKKIWVRRWRERGACLSPDHRMHPAAARARRHWQWQAPRTPTPM